MVDVDTFLTTLYAWSMTFARPACLLSVIQDRRPL